MLTLKLDLILYDKGLALVINLFGELGGDGVMGGCVLDNQTLITIHALEDGRLFDSPFTNIGPFLFPALGVLLGVGRLPSCLPVICELFDEVTLDFGGL